MIVEVPFFMGEPMPFRGQIAGDVRLEPELPPGTPQERMASLYRGLAITLLAAILL